MTCVRFDIRPNCSKHLSPAPFHLTAHFGCLFFCHSFPKIFNAVLPRIKASSSRCRPFFSNQLIDNNWLLILVTNSKFPLASSKKWCTCLVAFSTTLIEPISLRWPHSSAERGEGHRLALFPGRTIILWVSAVIHCCEVAVGMHACMTISRHVMVSLKCESALRKKTYGEVATCGAY